MAIVRRSQRLKQKKNYDEDEDGEAGSGTEPSSLQTEDQTSIVDDVGAASSSSSESDDNASDEDYEVAAKAVKAKKRSSSGRTSDIGRVKKKARVSKGSSTGNILGAGAGTKKEHDRYLTSLQDFKPTRLFEILSVSEDASIEEIASEWLDQYKDDRTVALKEFVNFLLNCCGSLVQVGEHDVVNNDSSNETVGEVQVMFQEQTVHEFYLYLSKTQKKRGKNKPLYDNFVEFMSKLIELANDKDMIYIEKDSEEDGEEANTVIETSPLMLDLLTWLSSFSVCKIRSLRYVATLAMYVFQDQLTELVVDLDTQVLLKLRKQLKMEQKKKRPNKKTVDKLEATIADVQSTKTVIESNIDNIVNLCFVHRFKDVDESLRSESMLHLAKWLKNHPEYFFKATYLKYFGWLLSDTSPTVRSQVLKTLSDIVSYSKKRHENMFDNSSLRQFFERFKQRILEIALKDVDLQVRLDAVQVLVEINGFRYLEHSEILSITSLIFYDHKVKVSSNAKNAKFLSAISKFFSFVEKEEVIEFLDTHDTEKTIGNMPLSKAAEVGIFMRFLIKSLSVHLRDEDPSEVTTSKKIHLLFQAAEFLQPYFTNMIEHLCQILVFDGSLSEFSDLAKVTSDDEMSDDEYEESGRQNQLLLPEDENTIIQYVTVLSGLCHGAMKAKNTPNKQELVETILSELLELFMKLNLDSSVIFSQLLSIFQLFQFEDWISVGQESSFQRIFEIIVKNFGDTAIDNEYDELKVEAFTKLLPFTEKLSINKIDNLWKQQLEKIKISLTKFLKQMSLTDGNSANEQIQTLHRLYLNKLVVLGKNYRIELHMELLELLFSKYVSQLPLLLHELSSEVLNIVDFRIFTQLVTWNLQTWYQIFEESETPSPVSRQMLDINKFVMDQLSVTVSTLHRCSSENFISKCRLQHSVLSSLLDITIASMMFAYNLSEKESEWNAVIRKEYPVYLDSPEAILEVYLYLEALYASKIGATLERGNEEDVNFNDVVYEPNHAQKDPEKQFCVYLLKLKSLVRLGLLKDEAIEKRIRLNQDVLGGLYQSIIDESIFKEAKPEGSKVQARHRQTATPESSSVPQSRETIRTQGELEPIEEFSQEEAAKGLTGSQYDPIEEGSDESQ
ncbi:HDL112Cp [Eremothecium sinecaudum]|uniref:HDL112Cp n=1 Tax=Eremothecium sinecaudum TaxID=45286 RepID=A0A0X8HSD5_9SACH|nr:HDL112Cp [Eremothecium sinecaudum]AMD20632.1 HDL112Cp [Eremothecium sinecaudum]